LTATLSTTWDVTGAIRCSHTAIFARKVSHLGRTILTRPKLNPASEEHRKAAGRSAALLTWGPLHRILYSSELELVILQRLITFCIVFRYAADGPVAIGICASDFQFMYYSSGIFDMTSCCTSIDHGSCIILNINLLLLQLLSYAARGLWV
jgi:hypothetical protein